MDLNIKPKIIKFPKENIGEKSFSSGNKKYFLITIPKTGQIHKERKKAESAPAKLLFFK